MATMDANPCGDSEKLLVTGNCNGCPATCRYLSEKDNRSWQEKLDALLSGCIFQERHARQRALFELFSILRDWMDTQADQLIATSRISRVIHRILNSDDGEFSKIVRQLLETFESELEELSQTNQTALRKAEKSRFFVYDMPLEISGETVLAPVINLLYRAIALIGPADVLIRTFSGEKVIEWKRYPKMPDLQTIKRELRLSGARGWNIDCRHLGATLGEPSGGKYFFSGRFNALRGHADKLQIILQELLQEIGGERLAV